MNSLVVTAAAAVGMTAAAVGAAAASTAKDFYVSARLTPRPEVPAPRAPVGAGGLLTGYLEGRLLTWRLSVHGLSGRAVAAHIHIAPRGKANPKPASPLCAPCRATHVGERLLGPGTLRAMRAGKAYVNVHTKQNPKGEVRGQLVLSAAPNVPD